MRKYVKTFLLLLVLGCCLAGCALTENKNADAEVNKTGAQATQSDADAEADGETAGSAAEGTEKATSAGEINSAGTEENHEKSSAGETSEEKAGEVTKNTEATGKTEEESTESETVKEAEEGTSAGETTASEPVIKDMATIMEEYNAQLDLEDNPFWDSLVYTGYNIEKHYADGLMWHYVLAANKRGKGWLSDITYAGGSLGYETTEDGLPDIEFFEDYGLVCASYVTYVYFNYLPNVAGIDTSVLTKPEQSYSANDWYIAAKDWVEKGYSKTIDFEASLTGAGFIDFDTLEEMPVGSIIAFCDSRNKSDYCSHVVIYAGYQNDYHWVYHVGNENGPEFCSVQRMHFGPDPQWPIAVISTPDFVMEAITAQNMDTE